jgi:hypothetical protein
MIWICRTVNPTIWRAMFEFPAIHLQLLIKVERVSICKIISFSGISHLTLCETVFSQNFTYPLDDVQLFFVRLA